MGRQRQPQIRQGLLDACTDYALEHGLPDRLGPLAAAAGTSSRMLIYHFATRDGLLREILGRARQRQVAADLREAVGDLERWVFFRKIDVGQDDTVGQTGVGGFADLLHRSALQEDSHGLSRWNWGGYVT